MAGNYSNIAQKAWTTWSIDPSVIGGTVVFSLIYLALVLYRQRKYAWKSSISFWHPLSFLFGVLIVLFALISPIDTVADTYLFSVHMLQHILIGVIAPPFLLKGLDEECVELLMSQKYFKSFAYVVMNPISAALLYNTTWLTWHAPPIEDAALYNNGIHITEHLTLIAVGIVFFWPLFKETEKHTFLPLSNLAKVIYLFVNMLPMTGVALLLMMTKTPLYSFYGNRAKFFGLTPVEDVNIGGVIMFFAHKIVFVPLMIVYFYRELIRGRFAPRDDYQEPVSSDHYQQPRV